MVKKVISSVVIIMFILSLAVMGNGVKAYSNSDFSIDVPSDYKSSGKNVWAKSNGDNFNIQIDEYDEKITVSLEDAYKQVMDEATKDSLYADVETKEVINISKNDYKCAHLKAKAVYSGVSFYVDQYMVISDNKIYVLTFSSADKSYFSSSEVEDVKESFTIENYKEPQVVKNRVEKVANNVAKRVLIGVAVGAVVGAISGVAYKIKRK